VSGCKDGLRAWALPVHGYSVALRRTPAAIRARMWPGAGGGDRGLHGRVLVECYGGAYYCARRAPRTYAMHML